MNEAVPVLPIDVGAAFRLTTGGVGVGVGVGVTVAVGVGVGLTVGVGVGEAVGVGVADGVGDAVGVAVGDAVGVGVAVGVAVGVGVGATLVKSYPITSRLIPSGEVSEISATWPKHSNASCTAGTGFGQLLLSQSPKSPVGS